MQQFRTVPDVKFSSNSQLHVSDLLKTILLIGFVLGPTLVRQNQVTLVRTGKVISLIMSSLGAGRSSVLLAHYHTGIQKCV